MNVSCSFHYMDNSGISIPDIHLLLCITIIYKQKLCRCYINLIGSLPFVPNQYNSQLAIRMHCAYRILIHSRSLHSINNMQQLHYVVSCPLHDKYSDPINHHCLLLWQSKFSPCITFVSIIYIICKVGAIVVVTE